LSPPFETWDIQLSDDGLDPLEGPTRYGVLQSPKPDDTPLLPNEQFVKKLRRAAAHERAGQLNAAEQLLRQILVDHPHQPGVLNLMGVVAFRNGCFEEAVRWTEKAIAFAPQNALFHTNLCEMYNAIGHYDDGLAAGLRAIACEPKESRSHVNLSVLHYQRLELEASIACARRALEIDPNHPGAHFGIAQAHLLQGNFEQGWQEYEWRFRVANVPQPMPPTDKPQWDGEPLEPDQRLLLIGDQGFGDVIQFVRYIPWAAHRCSQIALGCRAELRSILLQLPGVQIIFDHWKDKLDFVAYCPLSSLPRLAATTLTTIPAKIPYLRADSAKTKIWATRLKALVTRNHRRIGIAWAGRSTHNNDHKRSAKLSALAPLFALPSVSLLSLQKGSALQQVGSYWGRAPLVNLGPELRDFADTMAVIENLDLVVTVDTAIAHLAGAMGKPVWIALPHAPDWRWLLNRSDCPWYPTARLFRQTKPCDWTEVMASIAQEAARMLNVTMGQH
jgi:Tfp pilus assembly protein PilF